MTSFDDTSAVDAVGPGRWTARLAADWAQGRTTFGGLLAALTARVAREVAGPDRPLRTMDVAFLAPLRAGPVELAAEVLGEGKSVMQLAVSVVQDGVATCRVHVVAGAPRASAVRLAAAPPAFDGTRDPSTQGVELPYIEGVMPVFTQHVALRWCAPAFPFSGAGPEGARVSGWCRHRTPASGLEAVIALLDAWPPAVLPMASGPTPASTVRWSAHLVRPVPPGDERGWFWYEAQTVHCADGYATAHAGLYTAGGDGGGTGDRQGDLVLWSEQLIAVYDRPPASDPTT